MSEFLSHDWSIVWSLICAVAVIYIGWRKRAAIANARLVFGNQKKIWLVGIAAVAMVISLLIATHSH